MGKRHDVLPLRAPDEAGGLRILRPAPDDVIVRERRGNPHVDYLLGTFKAPDQFSVPTREEAVTRAVAFARKERLRTWFENGDKTFVLLGTFRGDK